MTSYGESLTIGEKKAYFYHLFPGKIQAIEEVGDVISVNHFSEWKKVSSDRYDFNFKDFGLKHYQGKENEIETFLIADTEFLMMTFCVQGNCVFMDVKNGSRFTFNSSEHHILKIPQSQLKFISNGELDLICIYLEKKFLLKYIPIEHEIIQKISSKTNQESIHNLKIDARIQSVLQDIINCAFDGHLKKLYIQAKIIELLSLQISQYEEEKKINPVGLKKSDIDKMMLVKEKIDNNLSETFTLTTLAREVGTNEQYLKKHFKILFGNTVFGYILSCKMEKAKELLIAGQYNIGDIALMAGYKHATHFTSAFKKYFGYLPQKIKGKA
jgi:AraC-like DNA-binding protein